MKDRLFIVPHTHYDAAVFKTRAEYLDMGLPIILQALQCLRDDPRYRFVLDQVCYIRPFLERYPEEAATLREMIAQGRLQITCGMDTMADVNIPSGESFIRQVLYGKRYCRAKLGIEVKVGWALDTFGHHPQMPQLLRRAGFDSYVFQRGVRDAQTPSEFYWEGIDGSRILSLWLPFSYGALFGSPHNLPEYAAFMRSRYEHLKPFAMTPNILGLSGVDLGPAEPHVVPLADLFNHDPAAPVELLIATPDEYLAALRQAIAEGHALPVVQGDLNPVFQGCYSSRIEVKQQNRELERLLTTVEKADALASWWGLPTDPEGLARAWEPVLFNQFHDLICGVQVNKVFEDTMRSYDYARRLATELLDARLESLIAQIDTSGEGIPLVVLNTLSWARDDVVEVEVGFGQSGVLDLGLLDPDGRPMPVQIIAAERYPSGGLKRARILFVARDVPALGYAVYRVIPNGAIMPPTAVSAATTDRNTFGADGAPELERDRGVLANADVRLELDLYTGALLSLKFGGYEFLRAGQAKLGGSLKGNPLSAGNVVARERDGGDFWELDGVLKGDRLVSTTRQQPPPSPGQAELSCDQVGAGIVRRGPVMAEFAISHPFGSGYIAFRVRVYAGLSRIDLNTEILNQDPWVRYRVLFPTTIVGGTITHEIPFGAIVRPEQELPAQHWIDYCDGQRGLALLNRGLPGNNVHDGVMMLSLLRASQLVAYGFAGGYEPGVASDSGQELGKRLTFDYALLPHAGDWRDCGVVQAGWAFNHPLIVRKAAAHQGRWPTRWGLLRLSPDHVIVSAVKPGDEGWIVVRVYEATGKPACGAELCLTAGIEAAQETNLLEDPIAELMPIQGVLRFDLGPFEIKTFRLRLAPSSSGL